MGAILLISHHPVFLDRTPEKIIFRVFFFKNIIRNGYDLTLRFNLIQKGPQLFPKDFTGYDRIDILLDIIYKISMYKDE